MSAAHKVPFAPVPAAYAVQVLLELVLLSGRALACYQKILRRSENRNNCSLNSLCNNE